MALMSPPRVYDADLLHTAIKVRSNVYTTVLVFYFMTPFIKCEINDIKKDSNACRLALCDSMVNIEIILY